ncbi:MAG: SDR family oxidoreductase [Gammaproteobacteria bacterium]|nr:SDR family oxidoreductase [Gammaproteobacteria bacterium]
MAGRLHGKTALITGASRGIGRAIACAYATEGANLILNARDPARLEDCAAELRAAHGVAVRAAPCDVTDRVAVAQMVAAADAGGGLDILVNNAGIHRAARFVDYTVDQLREMFETNVFGVLHITQLAIPGMIARGGGRIVNLASTAGKWGSRNQSAYNMSKHAIVGLTRCLGLELADQNVYTNAICPWIVDTDMRESFVNGHAAVAGVPAETIMTNWRNSVPIKRWIRPEEVAQLAVFLGSDEASYINGQAWTIDGGYTMI